MAIDRNAVERMKAMLEANPEQAQKLLEDVSAKILIPHSVGQREVLEAQERFLILCAGRRWGKTKVGAARGLREARSMPRRGKKIIWWVAPTYRVVKRGYQEVVSQLPAGTLARPAPPESAFDAGRSVVLQFVNGVRWEFYSAERPEGMLGGSADFTILDEAATMPHAVWTQFILPPLADRHGRALFISTPRGKNWYYRMWMRGQDEFETEVRSWRFPSFTNPTIDPKEWEELRQTMPQAIYEQEVLADFVSSGSSVFRPPDAAYIALQKPRGNIMLGVDLAKHNDFTVLTGVRVDDRKPCFHDRFNAVSWPEQRRRIRTAVDKLARDGNVVTVMLDSTGIGDVVYDDLSFEGIDAVPIKFTNQWKLAAVQLLGADLERGHAFLHEAQREEFESYSYTITDNGRWKFEAGSGHDDEVSAALLAHWGCVHEGVPSVRFMSDIEDEVATPGWEEEVLSAAPPTTAQLLADPRVWGVA